MGLHKAFHKSFAQFYAKTLCFLTLMQPLALHSQERITHKHIQFTLHSDHSITSPGQSIWASLKISIAEGWHIYWQNPGAGGKATESRWETDSQAFIKRTEWSSPRIKKYKEKSLYVYEKEAFIFGEIGIKAQAQSNTDFTIHNTIHWTLCKELCLPPQTATLTKSIPIRAQSRRDPYKSSLIAGWRRRVPKQPSNWQIEAIQRSDKIFLYIQTSDIPGLLFKELRYISPKAQTLETQDWQHKESEHFATIPTKTQHQFIKGLIEARHAQGSKLFALDAELGQTFTNHKAKAFLYKENTPDNALNISILFLAFLGGMILNVMPCVFPVLSLKVFALMENVYHDPIALRKHGVSFTCGVVLFFWILLGALLVFRSMTPVAWGFQLQSPAFVMGMSLFFFAIALNLLGVFEFAVGASRFAGIPGQYSGLLRSFVAGGLTTVSASPCSAPVLGSVIGLALHLPVWECFLVFSFVGLGMAAPFLLLTCFPKLLNLLPRPGIWVVVVKEFLGFVVLSFVLYLLWVLALQTDIALLCAFLLALLVFALGFWGIGVVQKSRQYSLARVWGWAAVGGVFVLAVYCVPNPYVHVSESQWVDFQREYVQVLKQEGKAFFIDFTAAWCITCQSNKIFVLDQEDVQKRFHELKITLIRADWTKSNPEITRALAEYQRAAVPLYILYSGETRETFILPEVLTKGILFGYLERLKKSP